MIENAGRATEAVTAVTGPVVAVDAVPMVTTAVDAVPMVTTAVSTPAVVEPVMMMSNILPVIFAVAVIKALVLGPSYSTQTEQASYRPLCFRQDEG